MAKIFISYRRDDCAYQADKLHAALKPHVANPAADIFIDIDNIPFGVDFVEHLDGKVAQCSVLFALIGHDWVGARNTQGGRRIDDPGDFVRIEIASALKRGIPVVPILLDGAPVPRGDDLPDDLKPLARRNGVTVSRASFDADVMRLVRGLPIELKGGLDAGAAASPPDETQDPVRLQAAADFWAGCRAVQSGDFQEAFRSLSKASAAGDARGDDGLGTLYQSGHGVKQDYAKARHHYQVGCDAGVARSFNNLGTLFHNGFGVKQDYAEARRLYLKGCESGDVRAYGSLGILYHGGFGVHQDYDEARRLYQKGCDAGDEWACNELKKWVR